MPPPTWATAALRAIVELMIVTSASPEIAPPRSSARLPLSVELMTVTSPSSVKIAPPGPSAVLPLTVESITVTSPSSSA